MYARHDEADGNLREMVAQVKSMTGDAGNAAAEAKIYSCAAATLTEPPPPLSLSVSWKMISEASELEMDGWVGGHDTCLRQSARVIPRAV